jgi:hypothetical protein
MYFHGMFGGAAENCTKYQSKYPKFEMRNELRPYKHETGMPTDMIP